MVVGRSKEQPLDARVAEAAQAFDLASQTFEFQ